MLIFRKKSIKSINISNFPWAFRTFADSWFVTSLHNMKIWFLRFRKSCRHNSIHKIVFLQTLLSAPRGISSWGNSPGVPFLVVIPNKKKDHFIANKNNHICTETERKQASCKCRPGFYILSYSENREDPIKTIVN